MKKSMFKMLSVALILAMSVCVLLVATACTKKDPLNNETTTLVLAENTMDGVFNPFFYSNAYDGDVVGMIDIGLLTVDRTNAVVCGDDYATAAKSYSIGYQSTSGEAKEEYEEGDEVVIDIVLKNGILFSDGSKLTAKDVMFAYYVYLNAAYDGSTTLYTVPFKGLNAYKTQIPAYDEFAGKADAILAAGDKGYEENTVYTAEEYAKYWEGMEACGVKFAQSIIDAVNSAYNKDAYVTNYFNASLTYADIAASDAWKAAFGYGMWGFGMGSSDGSYLRGNKLISEGVYDTTTWTDCFGKVYDMTAASTELPDATTYFACIKKAYTDKAGVCNYTVLDDTEVANYALISNVTTYFVEAYNQTELVSSISGLSIGTTTIDGVEYETIKVIFTEQNPKALLNLGVTVVPSAYYCSAYKYSDDELCCYGVPHDGTSFMASLKTFNGAPVGAGPYKMISGQAFVQDEDVYFERNDNFYTVGGDNIYNAKIKYVTMKVVASGTEYDTLKAGDVHYATVSATSDVMDDVADINGLTPILVDNLGYGYICINPTQISNLYERIAMTTLFDLDKVYEYYPNGLANVIYRSQSQVSWAYPEGATAMYAFDATCAKAVEYLKKAGYTYDEASKKFTDGPTYTLSLPSDAAQHPAGGIFLRAQELYATIGITVEIKTDTNLIANIKDGSVAVYALAWQAASDPDMYQVNHYASQASSVISNGIAWLYEHGTNADLGTIDVVKMGETEATTMTQTQALKYLGDLIEEAVKYMNSDDRKPIYAKALEVLAQLNIEIPTYQRKNLFVYNSKVIDASSLSTPATPYWGPMAEVWKVSFIEGETNY